MTDRDLEEAQDRDEAETRHEQEQGPATTPLAQTDLEQEEEGSAG